MLSDDTAVSGQAELQVTRWQFIRIKLAAKLAELAVGSPRWLRLELLRFSAWVEVKLCRTASDSLLSEAQGVTDAAKP